MKTKIITIAILAFFILSCEEEKPVAPDFSNKITITTGEAVDISTSSATVSGSLGETYNQNISDYGHCWDTVKTPSIDIAARKTSFGSTNKAESYISKLENLVAGKEYFVWAYYVIDGNTVYSEPKSFSIAIESAIINTSSITSITATTAISGGEILSDGGEEVLSKGICWSTSSIPTIANNKTSEASSSDTFESQLFGLSANTKYYVCAYVTTSAGTAYGTIYSFTTSSI